MAMSDLDPLCNLCGLTCVLGCDDHPCKGPHGLINKVIMGGYESTAGNGHGALDDITSYRFSLCEFCLDWLFGQFRIPVMQGEYMAFDNIITGEGEVWRPAAQRVAEDEWRSMKKEFQAEHDRRAEARKQRQ